MRSLWLSHMKDCYFSQCIKEWRASSMLSKFVQPQIQSLIISAESLQSNSESSST